MDEQGIYKIENSVTRSSYIGSSKNLAKRWIYHKKKLNKGTHENKHLQNAWNKYGESVFSFVVIEIRQDLSRKQLLIREQEYLDLYLSKYKDKCYNIATLAGSGPGPQIGHLVTEETKQKQSISAKGNKNATGTVRSGEFKKKIFDANSGELSHRAKLTWENVKIIRYLWENTETTYKALGLVFSVDPYTISRIINNKTWKLVYDK